MILSALNILFLVILKLKEISWIFVVSFFHKTYNDWNRTLGLYCMLFFILLFFNLLGGTTTSFSALIFISIIMFSQRESVALRFLGGEDSWIYAQVLELLYILGPICIIDLMEWDHFGKVETFLLLFTNLDDCLRVKTWF